jgi:hypothetical protein
MFIPAKLVLNLIEERESRNMNFIYIFGDFSNLLRQY